MEICNETIDSQTKLLHEVHFLLHLTLKLKGLSSWTQQIKKGEYYSVSKETWKYFGKMEGIN